MTDLWSRFNTESSPAKSRLSISLFGIRFQALHRDARVGASCTNWIAVLIFREESAVQFHLGQSSRESQKAAAPSQTSEKVMSVSGYSNAIINATIQNPQRQTFTFAPLVQQNPRAQPLVQPLVQAPVRPPTQIPPPPLRGPFQPQFHNIPLPLPQRADVIPVVSAASHAPPSQQPMSAPHLRPSLPRSIVAQPGVETRGGVYRADYFDTFPRKTRDALLSTSGWQYVLAGDQGQFMTAAKISSKLPADHFLHPDSVSSNINKTKTRNPNMFYTFYQQRNQTPQTGVHRNTRVEYRLRPLNEQHRRPVVPAPVVPTPAVPPGGV
jgi:hypothetical protein